VSTASAHPPPPALEVGHKVVVGRADKVRGVIRYLGPTAFADGEW
jgi:hypothetical protein